uniref:Uncharacterized protein n=1 Tax=Knipowitschia caucasica TaxID=637954 RepID=A0AAV2LI32_KNICA
MHNISRLTLELRESDRATIADLRKEVLRLTAELNEKQSLVSKLFEVAGGQHSRLMSLSAAYCDTVVWERSVSSGPSCSTPKRPLTNNEPADSEEPSCAVAHVLSLANRYAALSTDIPAPSAESLDTAAYSTARGSKSTARKTLLKEAVLRRKSGPPAMLACSPSLTPVQQPQTGVASHHHHRSPPPGQQQRPEPAPLTAPASPSTQPALGSCFG